MRKIVSMFFIIFTIITISFLSGCNKVKGYEYEEFNHGIRIIAASNEVKSREDGLATLFNTNFI